MNAKKIAKGVNSIVRRTTSGIEIDVYLYNQSLVDDVPEFTIKVSEEHALDFVMGEMSCAHVVYDSEVWK